jgi:hypothetical protein
MSGDFEINHSRNNIHHIYNLSSNFSFQWSTETNIGVSLRNVFALDIHSPKEQQRTQDGLLIARFKERISFQAGETFCYIEICFLQRVPWLIHGQINKDKIIIRENYFKSPQG